MLDAAFEPLRASGRTLAMLNLGGGPDPPTLLGCWCWLFGRWRWRASRVKRNQQTKRCCRDACADKGRDDELCRRVSTRGFGFFAPGGFGCFAQCMILYVE